MALSVSVVFCLGFCIRMWCVAPETFLRNFPHVRSPFLRVAVGNTFSGANFYFLLFVCSPAARESERRVVLSGRGSLRIAGTDLFG